MRKRLTAAIVAGSLGLAGAGAAVAIPALADSSPSPSASASAGPSAPNGAPNTAANLADRTARIRQQLQGLVDDKTITADQADKVAQELAQSAGPGRGWGGGGGGFAHGPGMMMGVAGPQTLAAVAKVLGMSTDDVLSALRGGGTLADLAKKQGKSEDDVIAAIVAAVKARIALAVTDGQLTQARADQMTSTLQQRVKDAVENGHAFGRPLVGGRPGWGGPRGGIPAPVSPPSSGSSSGSSTTQGTGFDT